MRANLTLHAAVALAFFIVTFIPFTPRAQAGPAPAGRSQPKVRTATASKPDTPAFPPVPVAVLQGNRIKLGYIDVTGRMVIPPRFDEAEPFANGLAVVRIDDHFGYIDMRGRVVIPIRFDMARRFADGRAVASLGGQWCYINKKGECAITEGMGFLHDELQLAEDHLPLGDFSEGLAPIYVHSDVTGDSTRYITPEGKVAFEIFGHGRSFRGGFALWSIYTGVIDVINHAGKAVVRNVNTGGGEYSEGLLAVMYQGRFHYVDGTGKPAVPGSFDRAGPFSEGLAAIEKDGKLGYVNRQGHIIFLPDCTDSGRFSQGLAPVQVGGLWGYINSSGKLVIPTRYLSAAPFLHGLGRVETAPFEYAYVDRSGRQVWPGAD